jgi:hypothetical protein
MDPSQWLAENLSEMLVAIAKAQAALAGSPSNAVPNAEAVAADG